MAIFSLRRSRPENKILVIGLDHAGVSTMMHGLRLGKVQTWIPTIGVNIETVWNSLGTARIDSVTTGGGGSRLRAIYNRFIYVDITAVVFVVDASDAEYFCAAAIEISTLVATEQLREASFLVVANKQDLPGALPAAELDLAFDLPDIFGEREYDIIDASLKESTEDVKHWMKKSVPDLTALTLIDRIRRQFVQSCSLPGGARRRFTRGA